jgi:hypothetical protein
MSVEMLTYAGLSERVGCSPEVPISPNDQRVAAALKARMNALEDELARYEASAAVHRAAIERERARGDRLLAEVLKTTADLMAAREMAARLIGELAALRVRPWWRRLDWGLRQEKCESAKKVAQH